MRAIGKRIAIATGQGVEDFAHTLRARRSIRHHARANAIGQTRNNAKVGVMPHNDRCRAFDGVDAREGRCLL